MPAHIYEPCKEMQDIIKELFQKRKDLFGDMIEFIYPEMIENILFTVIETHGKDVLMKKKLPM